MDGHPDIIVNTWSYGGSGDSTAIYAYDGVTHHLLWKNPIPKDVIYHGAAFGDVDEDGKPELAISSYDKNVYLLNGEDGSLKWQYAAADSAYVGDPLTIGDIDNDGYLDLVYIGGYGEVCALDRFGSLKWSFMLPLYESSFRGASLADVNNDDTLDVVFASTDGLLYALNGNRGNLLWSKDLRADYGNSNFGLEQGPIISNFRNDDTLDVFVVGGYANYPNTSGNFGRAYALKIGAGTSTSWSMFQHDITRSNCVCNSSPTGIASVSKSLLQINYYPNPFSQSIYFNISLDNQGDVEAIVYNAEGETVKTFSNKKLPAGNYQFMWNGTNDSGATLASGVYYCRITAGNISTVKKLVLVR
jgi:outer membrane protein assembly factor BamB